MKFYILDSWKARIDRLIEARASVCEEITLQQRNIYIAPSRNGMMYLLSAGLIFIAAINYAVSLAFALAFLMVSVFIVGVLHTYNNLHGLTLSAIPTQPVFLGEEIAFNVLLTRGPDKSHEALELDFIGLNSRPELEAVVQTSHADLVARDREEVQVFAAASRRGLIKAPILRIKTYFPLGIARAWSLINLQMYCLVYPKPIPFAMEEIHGAGSGFNESPATVPGSEEFYGIRDYVAGDSMHQVAWKAVARGQRMQVKQFVDYQDNRLWLDWDMVYGFGVEDRLSRLCYGVLQLSKTGNPFGLKIPGVEIPPGTGVGHRNRLLKALALFGTH